MEVLIAVIGLALGFILAFVLLRTFKKPMADEEEWNRRLKEKDEFHRHELEQAVEGQRKIFEAKEEEIQKSHQREKELMSLHNKEAAEQREKLHRETVERIEASHKSEISSMAEHNKIVLDELKTRHNEAMEALRTKFNETVNTMSEQLKTVTGDMLKQRQQEFSQSSQERIGQLLDPLQTTISEMRKAVAENTTRHSELGGRLDAGLKNLLTHTQSAQASAEKLATALRGNNKIQGEWGETVLRELLESQGLTEGIHFDTQLTLSGLPGASAEGSMMRPDVILHLGGGRELIIDSKVSMSGYLDYLEAETEEAREKALNDHLRSLQNHVKELSKKDYSRYIKAPNTKIDYVIMFVPNTSALMLATHKKPELWRRAMQDNVYIADEQTLYAALRIIDMTWTQIAQAHNQELVFDLAGQMIERVEQFLKSFEDIGTKLKAATSSFEAAQKKLKQGGHSIPQTGRKLIELGARASKGTAVLDAYLEDTNDDPAKLE